MKVFKYQTKKLKYFLEYILVVPLFFFFNFFSIKNKGIIANFIGRYVIYYFLKFFNKQRYSCILNNLSLIQKNESRKHIVEAREYCGNLARVFAQVSNQTQITKEFLEKNVSVEGHEEFLLALQNGRSIIIPSAHIGNWEIAHNYLHKVHGLNLSLMYRGQNNSKVDAIYLKVRSHAELIEKRDKNALRKLFDAIKNKKIIIVLLDQRDIQHGHEINFFGKTAMLPTAISRVAIKNECLLFPAYCLHVKDDKFHIKFEKPIEAKMEDSAEKLTEKIFKHFEEWIEKNPTQWFCLIQNIWRR